MLLYKYFNAANAERVLTSRKLRFTPPGEFNDLFEFRPLYQNLNESQTIRESLTQENIRAESNRWEDEMFKGSPNLRSIYKRATEGVDAPRLAIDSIQTLLNAVSDALPEMMFAKFNEMTGVLCLTELPNQPVMWGSYGDNHRGVVLGFDSEHRFFDQRRSEVDELRHLVQVTYHGDRPEARLLEDDDSMAKIVSQKLDDWSYEREWRKLQVLRDADEIIEGNPTVHLFSFAEDALRQVIFGARASDKTLEAINSVLSVPEFGHVNRFRIEPDVLTRDLHLANL